MSKQKSFLPQIGGSKHDVDDSDIENQINGPPANEKWLSNDNHK